MAAPASDRPRSGAGPGGGYSIGLLAAAILATTAVLIRHLSLAYHLPALVMAFWRDVAVVVTLVAGFLAWGRARFRLPPGTLPYLAVYGLVLSLFNVLWTLSVTINGAAVATVLVYCSAAFTVVLGRWLLKEPLGVAKLLATVLCLGGCVLVSGAHHAEAWRANLAGILAGALSGLSYAAYSLMGRSAAQRGLDPWTTLLYIFGFASGFLFLFNLPPGGFLPGSAARLGDFFWLGRAWGGWGILFLLGAGPTVAGFGLYLVSLARLPSSVANLVVSLEPAFTALFAYLFLGERLGLVQAAGGLLILGGVAVLRVGDVVTMLRGARAAVTSGP
jgi:drug/metabolite transporter (DMT)-like permease